MTDHQGYRHIAVSGVQLAGSDEKVEDRLAFYMLNMEHGQSEANMQISNSSHVDIYGLKVEGSLPVLWVSDSNDVRLFGMGGGADAFPNRSYYPADLAPYPPSMIRMERSTNYKLINLFNGGRGAEGSPIMPIGKFPLTPQILSTYDWSVIPSPLFVCVVLGVPPLSVVEIV